MRVAIIDYGSGNLRSAAKAFAWAADAAGEADAVRVTADPVDLAWADHIVLPGVGAFAECKRGLDAVAGMREALEEQVIGRGKPFLGICVGMQLTATEGHEHRTTAGFGWLPGKVVGIAPGDGADGRPLKVPHMGWNQLSLASGGHPVLDGLSDGAHVYFVHGYHLCVEHDQHLLATTDYGQAVTAVVGRDNIVGTQFHPEKSQAVGLRLISNFLAWRP
jgi:glutamine amidotransferase